MKRILITGKNSYIGTSMWRYFLDVIDMEDFFGGEIKMLRRRFDVYCFFTITDRVLKRVEYD